MGLVVPQIFRHQTFLSLFFIRIKFRGSCPEVFHGKSVVKDFAKFTGKHLCQSLVLNKVACLSPGKWVGNSENVSLAPFECTFTS